MVFFYKHEKIFFLKKENKKRTYCQVERSRWNTGHSSRDLRAQHSPFVKRRHTEPTLQPLSPSSFFFAFFLPSHISSRFPFIDAFVKICPWALHETTEMPCDSTLGQNKTLSSSVCLIFAKLKRCRRPPTLNRRQKFAIN